jgi:hypothetical protein
MSRRRTRSRRVKLALLATMAIGAVGGITVPGVWANFTADAGNMQATAMSGTLTMNMTVDRGSGPGAACASYLGTSNANTSCDAMVVYSPTAELYPGEPKVTKFALVNTGSLNASDLRLYMPGGCTFVATPDAPAPGGASPCAATGMQLYIQENSDASGTPLKCWYPAPAAAGACSTWSTLSSFAIRTTAALGLSFGAGPNALQTRYFQVGVQLPATAANTLQGEAAKFVLAWHLTS